MASPFFFYYIYSRKQQVLINYFFQGVTIIHVHINYTNFVCIFVCTEHFQGGRKRFYICKENKKYKGECVYIYKIYAFKSGVRSLGGIFDLDDSVL